MHASSQQPAEEFLMWKLGLLSDIRVKYSGEPVRFPKFPCDFWVLSKVLV